MVNSAATAGKVSTACDYYGCFELAWGKSITYPMYCPKHCNSAKMAPAMCKSCLIRPVHVEQSGHAHPFCDKRCAAAYAGLPPPPPPPAVTGVQCKLDGCSKAVYTTPDGKPSDFCSIMHRKKAVLLRQIDGCLLCLQYPKEITNGTESDFCSKRCAERAVDMAPLILPMPPSDRAYQEVLKQFRDQWRHQTAIPKVAKIWKIYGSQDAHNDFVQYRHTVARKSGIPSGNARRRWHGTVRACRLGDTDQHDQLCSMSACALCSIIHDSFSVAHVGVRTSWSRFGHGLYFTATSSKANDYASGPAQSRYKAMLLNDVVLGQTYKVVGDNPSLTNPPYGYDSVLGEPGFGNLNYDECVVYTPSAVRTSFLVIYEP